MSKSTILQAAASLYRHPERIIFEGLDQKNWL